MPRVQSRVQFRIAHAFSALVILSLLFGLLSLGGYALFALPLVLILGSLARNAMIEARRKERPADRALSLVYCAAFLFLLMLLIGGMRLTLGS